ncbi:MAG: hypothetical protein Q9167_004463 [Letrouitia subvulpina]
MDQSRGQNRHFINYITDPNKDIVEYRLDTKTGLVVKEEFEVEDVYEKYPAVSSDSLALSCTQSQSKWEIWEKKQDGKKLSKPIPGLKKTLQADECYTFEPTVAQFRDFETLLAVVEEISGRELGYARVKMPEECLAPRPKGVADHLIAPKTLTHRMRLETIRDPTDKSITPFAERINLSTNPRVKQKAKRQPSQGNMSEHQLLLKDRKRDRGNIQKNVAMNVDATERMRYFLRLGDPGLANLPGNLFMEHPSSQQGLQSPLLNISGNEGVATSFRLSPLGAYSVHYLHYGANTTWTITSPYFTTSLAENIHRKTGYYGPKSPVTKPYNPPGCSEFVKHLTLYLYEKTLEDWGVEHTRVLQQPGEVLIIFPFAYYQNYSNGFNITEAASYANERWKELYRNGLISQCSESCGRGPHEVVSKPIRLDSMLGRAELQSSRQRRRKRSPESPTDIEPQEAQSVVATKRRKLPPRLELAPKDTMNPKTTPKKKWFSPTSSRTPSTFQLPPRSSSFPSADQTFSSPQRLPSSANSPSGQPPSRPEDPSDSISSSSDTPLIQRRCRHSPGSASRKKQRISIPSKRDSSTLGDNKEVAETSHLPGPAIPEHTTGDTTEDDDMVLHDRTLGHGGW